jgi:uncharacterized protein YpuA (DUF1002 family)
MANGQTEKWLEQLNNKSGKKWSMDDIKSLAKGFSKKDLQNDKKLEELIKRVGKAAGVNLSNKQVDSVKKQLSARFPGLK